MLAVLIACANLCKALFYAEGFEIEGDKGSCFCADRVSRNAEEPLPITLKLPKKYFEEKELYGPGY